MVSNRGVIVTFEPRKQQSVEKKKALLELARAGARRPHCESPLGQALENYTRKGSPALDSAFSEEIRSLRPEWWENKVVAKKAKLLEAAQAGRDRDDLPPVLKIALRNYTTVNGGSYDPVFARLIRSVAPAWLVKRPRGRPPGRRIR